MCIAGGFWRTVWLTLEAANTVDALQQAYGWFGKPEIINTDQASQFTAQEFFDAVLDSGVKLFMDGRGAWRDNVFVERIWRSVKDERVYLQAYRSVAAARTDIAEYIDWYNHDRGHSNLDDKTPEQAWPTGWPLLKEAA
jgi:putative transposase